jgi:hypothetical protein
MRAAPATCAGDEENDASATNRYVSAYNKVAGALERLVAERLRGFRGGAGNADRVPSCRQHTTHSTPADVPGRVRDKHDPAQLG